MVITVKMFGTYIQYLPPGSHGSSATMDVSIGTTVAGLLAVFQLPDDEQKVVLLNGTGSDLDTPLKDGDVIAVFEAIAGGTLSVLKYC